MSTLRIFFAGLFTRHLGTKFLSLLLSVIIILLVQQSLTSVRDIPLVRLVFRLEKDLAENYVLLRDEIEMADLRIKGLHSIVDPMARERFRQPEVSVLINERFFNRYRDKLFIPVTTRLLADQALFGPEIEIVNLPGGQAVLLDERVRKTLPVVLAPGQEERLTLAEDTPYESTDPKNPRRLQVAFSIADVEIEGPKRSLADATQLCISIGDLNYFLRRFESEEDEVTIEDRQLVEGIDLKASGIFTQHREHLRIVAPRGMSLDAFERDLKIRFTVRQELTPTQIRADIQVLYRRKDPIDLSQYESLGKVLLQGDLDQGFVEDLTVQVPKSLLKDKDLLDNLTLVVDLTRAEPVGEDLTVPVYLKLKVPGSVESYRKLRTIVVKGQESFRRRG